jgi:hypothetical protein
MRDPRIWLLAAAGLALGACGKKEKAAETAAQPDPAAAAETIEAAKPDVELPAGFPKMTASYRAVYQAHMGDDGPREMTMEVAGGRKLRFEMPHMAAEKAAAGARLVGVFDDAANRSLMYVEGPGAQNVAIVIPQEEDMFDMFLDWAAKDGATLRKAGSDEIAGLKCDIWEAPASEDETAEQACMTRDGILLRSGDAGDETPDLLAVSVDKGPVDAARFAVPGGFEIVDMGPCQTMMQESMAAAQSGKMPDMAKMAECEAVGRKAAAVFGDFGE